MLLFEGRRVFAQVQGQAKQSAGAVGDLRADKPRIQGAETVLFAQGLNRGDEIAGAVHQRAIQIEQYGAQRGPGVGHAGLLARTR